jgi:CAAX protease family protein
MASTETVLQPPDQNPPGRIPAVAPVWHTALFVVVLLGISLLQAMPRFAAREAQLPSRIPTYIFTMCYEFVLVGYVWLGAWLRHTKLRDLIGGRWAQWKDFWTDVLVAFLFWLVVLGVLATLSWAVHFNGNEAASFLMPQTIPEMILWVMLAATAGFCEELVFRGYLQWQCLALTQNVAAAVILQGVIFGTAHAYQGARGVIVISIYGMMFGALAAMRKSLRPGMMQHATEDGVSGIVYHFASKLRHLPLIRF